MIQRTKLTPSSILPLTCSRTGTCCHGKFVFINPWELRCLAKEKNISPNEFRALYAEYGGIRLKFNGKIGWDNQPACSLYVDNFGCSVHLGRPLSCRLYPLGRQIQNNEAHYMYQGQEFPCLKGCPEVVNLPQMRVDAYLKGQETENFEKAQDEYLELMQQIADIGFELYLDTGLAASGDTKTLALWQEMGQMHPDELVKIIGNDWLDCLIVPSINNTNDNRVLFVQQHSDLLMNKIQEAFGIAQTNEEFHKASVLLIGIALHLARAIGADPAAIAEHWVETAENLEALE